MGAQTIDYRISKVVVCCKDCGQDVGLYPARHRCQEVVRPPLPPLPTNLGDGNALKVPRKPVPSYDNDNQRSRPNSAASSSSGTCSSSPQPSEASSATSTSTGGKWSRLVRSAAKQPEPQQEDENASIYYDKFAEHLPETTSESSGRKMWGKVRENEKLKQLSDKYEKPKQSAKLWEKLVQATQNMADKIPSRDDRGPESDESDWEGETHVSRVLREYYERKNAPLPDWLFDSRTPAKKSPTAARQRHSREYFEDAHVSPEQRRSHGRKQKLWEASVPEQQPFREREREHEHIEFYRYQQQQQQQQQQRLGDRSDRYDRYESSPRPPPSPSRSGYSGYEADDDYYGASSRRRGGYLDEPSRNSPARSRSPSRGYRDYNDDYYDAPRHYPSPPSPRGDRLRGPREIPSRYPERAGDYF